MSSIKGKLIKILNEKAFQYNEKPIFKLVSGMMSNYYVDCKMVTMDPMGMFIVGNVVNEIIERYMVDAVGGLTFGADPIAMATAYASNLYGKRIKAFSIRKELKNHGIKKWIEGNVKEGDKVCIVEDVATTGNSAIRAINKAREEGLIVEVVVVLVDTHRGGMESIKEIVENVYSVVTITDLIEARGE